MRLRIWQLPVVTSTSIVWDLIRGDWRKYVTEDVKEKKGKLREELLQKHFPDFLPKISGYVKRHGVKWLVCDRITWSGFIYANLMEVFEDYVYGADILGWYPELIGLRNGVRKLRAVNEGGEKRPLEKVE